MKYLFWYFSGWIILKLSDTYIQCNGNFSKNLQFLIHISIHRWEAQIIICVPIPKAYMKGVTPKSRLKNGRLTTISRHFFGRLYYVFHKTEIQIVILRCLMSQISNCIKSYDIASVKVFFFHAWKRIISGLVYQNEVFTPPKEISSRIFKMAIFPKFFGAFMKHIIW